MTQSRSEGERTLDRAPAEATAGQKRNPCTIARGMVRVQKDVAASCAGQRVELFDAISPEFRA